MSKTKSKNKGKGSAAAEVLKGSGTITLKQKVSNGKGGYKLVDREFELIPYEDLPRQVRRQIRNAAIKAVPDGSSALDKADIFLAAYDVGLVALRAAGAELDPNDETMTAAVADEIDQTISVVGLRVIGEMNSAAKEGGGDSKNAEETPMEEGVALSD